MNYLETIRKFQEKKVYNIDEIWPVLEEIEDTLGAAEMWNTVKSYFPTSDLLDILEYICTEKDI